MNKIEQGKLLASQAAKGFETLAKRLAHLPGATFSGAIKVLRAEARSTAPVASKPQAKKPPRVIKPLAPPVIKSKPVLPPKVIVAPRAKTQAEIDAANYERGRTEAMRLRGPLVGHLPQPLK